MKLELLYEIFWKIHVKDGSNLKKRKCENWFLFKAFSFFELLLHYHWNNEIFIFIYIIRIVFLLLVNIKCSFWLISFLHYLIFLSKNISHFFFSFKFSLLESCFFLSIIKASEVLQIQKINWPLCLWMILYYW
jgi:hypothetical protein